jgi:hypothetical protein
LPSTTKAPNAYASTRHHNRQNVVKLLLERLKLRLPGLEGFAAYDNRAIQVRKEINKEVSEDGEEEEEENNNNNDMEKKNKTEQDGNEHDTPNKEDENNNKNDDTNNNDKKDDNKQNGNKGNNKNKSTNHRKQRKQKRAIAFIALHHFHPYLIQSFFNKPTPKVPTRHFNFRLTILKEELNTNIPDHGLTEEDEVEGMDSYLCIPDYPIAAAERDAMQQELVASLMASSRGGGVKQDDEKDRDAETNDKESQKDTDNNNANQKKRRQNDIELTPENRKREALRIRENPEDVAQEIHVLRGALVSAVTSQTAQERVNLDEFRSETATSAKFEVLTGDQGGYNRLGFLSDDWHDCHPRDAKLMWGFETWEDTKEAIGDLFHLEAPVPSMKMSTRKLELFERCLIARTSVWLGSPQEMIASWWGIPRHTVCRCIKEWTPRWESKQLQGQTTTPADPAATTAQAATTTRRESNHDNNNTTLPKHEGQRRSAKRDRP